MNKYYYIFRALLSAFILIWIAGFSILTLFPNSELAIFLYPLANHFYSHVCHQVDAKSFYIAGHKLLVCARCTGIYLGVFFMSLLTLFVLKRLNLNRTLLIIAAVPMLLDVIFTTIGLYQYSKELAFLTGFLFGSIVFMYISAILENSFVKK